MYGYWPGSYLANFFTDANTDTVIARPGERITDAQLSPEFKALRDSPDTKDILKNADSLALLGQACDAEMRRVRKRALMEGDHVSHSFYSNPLQ